MKRHLVLFWLTLFVAVSAVDAMAQPARRHKPRLRVSADREFLFDTRSEVDLTQTMAGQEINITVNASGTAHLRTDSVEADRITWSFRVPELAVSYTGPTLPGGSKDTVIATPVRHFVTDREGTVLEQHAEGAEASQSDLMLQAGLQGGFTTDLFSPVIAHKAKPGDSWESVQHDTVGSGPLSLRRTTTTRYTYDGLVDTLERSTMRLRSVVTSMSMEGTIQAQGMDLGLAGEGEASSVYYHDAVSGVLVAGISDSEMQMRVTLSGQVPMVIPMVSRVRQTMRAR